jgi:hypothetical protein
MAMAILLVRAIGDDKREQEQGGGAHRLSGNRRSALSSQSFS